MMLLATRCSGSSSDMPLPPQVAKGVTTECRPCARYHFDMEAARMKAELDSAAGAGGDGAGDLGGARLDGDALMHSISGLRGEPIGQDKAEYGCDVLSQARLHLRCICLQGKARLSVSATSSRPSGPSFGRQAQHERPRRMREFHGREPFLDAGTARLGLVWCLA